ncbi:MAG: GNAT family N-acetyltransferase [Labilibaculum antarcticum]
MYDFHLISIDELKEIEYDGKFLSCDSSWICKWYSIFKDVENNVLGYKKTPYIISVCCNDKLVAIVPLVKLQRVYCKCFTLEFVEFLDQQWCSMGNDIIALKPLNIAFANELQHWIRKNIRYHFLFLKYLPKTTVLCNKYKLYHYAGEPIIPMAEYSGYENFLMESYAKRFRKQLERTLRKIERDGFEFELSTEEINESSFKEIKRIAKSKIVDGKGFVYGDPNKEKFFLQMFKAYSSQVMFVSFNKTAIAYVINIDKNGKRLAIDCAFDRDYKTYGAGIHCMNCNIQNSFKLEHKKFSFGVGLDPYKFQFTRQAEPSYMCFDFKYRLKSLLALPYLLYRVKKTDRTVVNHLQKVHCDVEV